MASPSTCISFGKACACCARKRRGRAVSTFTSRAVTRLGAGGPGRGRGAAALLFPYRPDWHAVGDGGRGRADCLAGDVHNTFRYYNPEVEQFVTQAPIGLDGGSNLYRYVPNRTGWIDPLGWTRFDASGRPLSSSQYSICTSVKMPQDIHASGRPAHFRYANEELYNRTLEYPELNSDLPPEVVEHIKPGPRGEFSEESAEPFLAPQCSNTKGY